MDNEAAMIILFVSHENKFFALLEFDQILICQNQKLQIPNFMAYKAPGVQLTKIKYDISEMGICHEFPWHPLIQIRIFSPFTLLWAKL